MIKFYLQEQLKQNLTPQISVALAVVTEYSRNFSRAAMLDQEIM